MEIIEAQVNARLQADPPPPTEAPAIVDAEPGTLDNLRNEAVRITKYADDAQLMATLVYKNRSLKRRESVLLAALVTSVLVESGRGEESDKLNVELARRAGLKT
ncbi:hypothetical protein B2_10 [Stenotrophomonas phage B2]|nr:hypothetical protein B2_10 [Stenotrophomonas phage B2]